MICMRGCITGRIRPLLFWTCSPYFSYLTSVAAMNCGSVLACASPRTLKVRLDQPIQQNTQGGVLSLSPGVSAHRRRPHLRLGRGEPMLAYSCSRNYP